MIAAHARMALLAALCLALAGCGVAVGFTNSPLPPNTCGVATASSACNR